MQSCAWKKYNFYCQILVKKLGNFARVQLEVKDWMTKLRYCEIHVLHTQMIKNEDLKLVKDTKKKIFSNKILITW